jgi:predicted AlkP superfamily pyrophosphatase or phosphodiesterase
MYNPDAIAQWIYEKYPQLVKGAKSRAEIEIPLCSVMPSVTPVCFGTMYTGAQPAVHGIRKYEKPVIKIDSIFDAAIRAGKKCAIVSYGKSSLSNIFLEREMDYFLFPDGGVDAVNAKAAELIMKDEHDLIVIYNGNYDSVMHKKAPEGLEALCELRSNDHAFCELCELVERHMSHRNVLMGFAMDHGCHEIDGENGSHGLDMEEDLNIVHLYKGYKKK